MWCRILAHTHLASQNGRPRRAATGTAAAAEAANRGRKKCNQHAPGAIPTRDGRRLEESFAAREDGLAAGNHGQGAALVEKRYAFTSFSLKYAPPSFVAKHARANVHELRLPS